MPRVRAFRIEPALVFERAAVRHRDAGPGPSRAATIRWCCPRTPRSARTPAEQQAYITDGAYRPGGRRDDLHARRQPAGAANHPLPTDRLCLICSVSCWFRGCAHSWLASLGRQSSWARRPRCPVAINVRQRRRLQKRGGLLQNAAPAKDADSLSATGDEPATARVGISTYTGSPSNLS